jgi:hypothetical protein
MPAKAITTILAKGWLKICSKIKVHTLCNKSYSSKKNW